MLISHFDRYDSKPREISFPEAMEAIRCGNHKNQIDPLRHAIRTGETEKADLLKKQLPSFSFSGSFEVRRTMNHLKHYLPIIGLDIDDIGEAEAILLRERVNTDSYVLATFISPSRNGLKVFFKHSGSQSDHKRAFEEVSNFFRNKYEVVLDDVVKDITRLCFYSFDPDLLFNPDCDTFQLLPIPKSIPAIEVPIDVFQAGLDRLDMASNYKVGGRNNFIYRLACWCNRGGLSMEDCMDKSLAVFDLVEQEILSSVKSAYVANQHEHGKFRKLNAGTKDANPAMQTKKEDEDQDIPYSLLTDPLANTPYLINFDVRDMPELIRKSAEVFSDRRERDVMFLAVATVLSACFYNTSGNYRNKRVWPNLFSFVVAPPASGKGAMDFAMQLINDFNDSLLKASEKAREDHQRDVDRFEQLSKEEKANKEKPKAPAFKTLVIPANTSYAKLLWHLKQNDGFALMFETEADSLGDALKTEWASYSSLLRKAFHHEDDGSSRSTDAIFLRLCKIKMSIALAGTPDQLMNIVVSAENGLMSRFLFYAFKGQSSWQDVSPQGSAANLTEYFEKLSKEASKTINFLIEHPTIVDLSQEQWQILNAKFSDWLRETELYYHDEAGAIVKRLGLILFRFCMIFTSLRKYERSDPEMHQVCTDTDFHNAMEVVKNSLQHNLLVFQNLSKNNRHRFIKADYKKNMFDELPKSFSRSEAVTMGLKHGMKTRNVDHFLAAILDKLIKRMQPGKYEKLEDVE